jgi:hypothetical protein
MRRTASALSTAYSPDGVDEDEQDETDPFAKALRIIDDAVRPKAVGYGR